MAWLVCFALGMEARPFRARLPAAEPIEVLVTGMGPRRARLALEECLASAPPRAAIAAGLAGALDPRLPRFTVLYEADPGFPRMHAWTPAGAQPGRFTTQSRIASTAAAKAQLRAETGADAVDMESEALRDLCRRHQVPSATVRVISDLASEDIPLDFNRFLDPDGRWRWARLLASLARSPRCIAPLVRFQHCNRLAARHLASALVAFLAARPAAGPDAIA
ncbi:MAG TPA: hypothetical protein P5555_06285 [Candidatus Paceibacterota bacterium]|nr:hypothetical protein [Verrucomicrobiota bacterium]HRZ44780.1 hypothetical protein [Candidatus Paceibacterota bacterium]HRZ92087.1 hypothetical protein [Candidatus Paceibacterota bacterium]